MLRRFLSLFLFACLAACAGTPEVRDASQVQLPDFPKASDLLEFPVSAASGNHFMIDRRSMSIDPDREVRLTVVVRAPGGAETVTHEAIRCQSAEYRIYAVGRRDGTWTRLVEPTWRRIEESGLNRHRAALASEYLCDGPASVRAPEEALRAMQNPSHMRHGIGAAP